MSRWAAARRLAAVAVVGALVVATAACGGRPQPTVGAPLPSATTMPQDGVGALTTVVGTAEQLATAVESDLAGDAG